jgi:8-oxo-dGTP pyrophosphatase MutT (NUDIX family)
MVNCYGFIILDVLNRKTILVETPNNNLSYPKGKFEKKKDYTQLDCAIRELEEETGLKPEQIDMIPNLILSEINDKKICTIQYYVGIIKNPITSFIFDTEEIISVKWYDYDKIFDLDKLKQSRKDVFFELMQIMNKF